jgi:hypothetical protein
VPGAQTKTPSLWGMALVKKGPGSDLLSHADAHYHRRGFVSLPSSRRDRVVPNRYGRQGDVGVALCSERGLGVVTWDVNRDWNVSRQRVVEA